jgi:hypothetical protein
MMKLSLVPFPSRLWMLKDPPHHVESFFHGHQSQPASGSPRAKDLSIKAPAVVLHDKLRPLLFFWAGDNYCRWLRMFADIRQGFLKDDFFFHGELPAGSLPPWERGPLGRVGPELI